MYRGHIAFDDSASTVTPLLPQLQWIIWVLDTKIPVCPYAPPEAPFLPQIITSPFLAASSVSSNDGTSIVLTNGTTLDKNIINYINENKSSIENVYIVGGTNSVNDSVTDNIDFEATRVSGSNRVATSLEIANVFFKENKNVVLADGRNFPDALAAGGLSKKDKAPIILNDSDVINKEIINFVNTNEIENITIIGGMYSVPNYPSK